MSLTRYRPELLESPLGGKNMAAMEEHENGAWYRRREVDALLAEKDAEIARLKERKSPDIADVLALRPVGKSLVDPGLVRKEPVEDTREAVAELKDPYYTHCVICDKPWGAGELHAMHTVKFHGRFIVRLFTCCACNAKIRRGEI